MPGHFYELFPIAVLIGTIYALARLAQSSEFTILRTGGLGPGRALGLLTVLGADVRACSTFVVGDYVAPLSERAASTAEGALHAAAARSGSTGAWLKDRRTHARRASAAISVNVARARRPTARSKACASSSSTPTAASSRRIAARQRTHRQALSWQLDDAEVTHWPDATGQTDALPVREELHAQLHWPSTLDAGVVAAAVLPVTTMSTVELWRYSQPPGRPGAGRAAPRRSSSGRRRCIRWPAW